MIAKVVVDKRQDYILPFFHNNKVEAGFEAALARLKFSCRKTTIF